MLDFSHHWKQIIHLHTGVGSTLDTSNTQCSCCSMAWRKSCKGSDEHKSYPTPMRCHQMHLWSLLSSWGLQICLFLVYEDYKVCGKFNARYPIFAFKLQNLETENMHCFGMFHTQRQWGRGCNMPLKDLWLTIGLVCIKGPILYIKRSRGREEDNLPSLQYWFNQLPTAQLLYKKKL